MEEQIVDLRENASSTNAPKRKRGLFFFVIVGSFLACVGYVWYLTTPPEEFPEHIIIEIPSGSHVRDIAFQLEKEGIIRSPMLFGLLVKFSGREKGIQSGSFLFPTKIDLAQVTRKILATDRGIARLRITIPEGMTLAQTAALVAKELPAFSESEFLSLTEGREGYLFPDTYFFFSNATTGPIVVAMEENFNKKTNDIRLETLALGKKWGDIVTMASIIEEEAVTDEDQLMVSGILWNRIDIGMRLQVDASFAYLLGKSSSEITAEDLKMDSPFNTYLHKGLPPTPIANPGLRALTAALHPTASKYLYYLSDGDGVMHYAKTFEEHKANKAKYLR